LMKKYKMSFTAGTILQKESISFAKLYLEVGNWDVALDEATSLNVLQSRTVSTAKRISLETLSRLKMLNNEELELLVDGDDQEQLHLLWLSVCRYYPFIYDFSIDVIRDKVLTLSYQLSHDDFDVFFNAKMQWHEELEKIAETTRYKLRQVLFKMMTEVGFINKEGGINPATLSERVARLICKKTCEDLLIFPMTSATLQGYQNAS
ncbi:MAG TPA: DUF1819 family protein, partial [Candidatus Thioglobus autotrophicus]|nr:DUF1819 family protein [Candidatus Thioglobus autotrophicus]